MTLRALSDGVTSSHPVTFATIPLKPRDIRFHHMAGVEAGFFFFKKPLDLVAFADVGVVRPARRYVIAEQAQREGVAFPGFHGLAQVFFRPARADLLE